MAAAMVRSSFAGLVLRRSLASQRLPSCLPAASFSDNTAAGRIERSHMDETEKEEAEKAQQRRTQQRHGFSNGQQSDSFYTTLSWGDIKLPRGSYTDSAKTSSSLESSTDISSRSSWSWGSGDSGGGDSCSGEGSVGAETSGGVCHNS